MSAPTVSGTAQLEALNALPQYKRDRVLARLAILKAVDAFVGDGPSWKIAEFCDLYTRHAIDLPGEVHEAVDKLSPATIYRWKQKLRNGIAGLADGHGKRAGTGVVDTNDGLKRCILGLLMKHPYLRPRMAHTAISALAHRIERPELIQGVTEDHIRHYLDKWKEDNAQLYLFVSNPDQWKSRCKAASGIADENITRLNQLWELDATPGDVNLIDGRHSVIGCIDVYSRRLMLLVSKTSTAVAVAALLRRCILAWGIPEAVRTDNGKEFTSSHIEAALTALNIEHKLCIPFASEEKPFIERSFRTFSHGLLELKSGFIGHNVAELQAIRGVKKFSERLFGEDAVQVKMTAADLQAFCDEWLSTIYEQHEHEGIGGLKPAQRAANWTGAIRRIEAGRERALDVLLETKPERRTVTKKGIAYDNTQYDAPELAGLELQEVILRQDAADLGRLYVYDTRPQTCPQCSGDDVTRATCSHCRGTGRIEQPFVCIASAPERAGITARERAAARKAKQMAGMRAGRAHLKELQREVTEQMKGAELADVVMAARREQEAQVIALPRASETYTTPALEESAKAAEASAALPPAPIVPLARVREALNQEAEDRAFRDAQWARYKRLQSLREQPGYRLSEDDASWLSWFITTPVFKAKQLTEALEGRP